MKTIRLFFFASLALFTIPSPAADAPARLPEMPQAATSFGAAITDGWLYTYGGNTGKAHEFHRGCINGDFFRVHLSDGRAWEKLPSAEPLLGAPMAAHAGWIYRIGGLEARNAKGEKNDLHSTALTVRFSPIAQRWEKLPPLPEPRSSHDLAVLGDILYAGGGWRLAGSDGEGNGAVWHKTLLALDLRAPERGWREMPQKFQRRAIAVVAHIGRLWFLGGMDANDEPSRKVDWFDPASNEWGTGPDLPDGAMAGFGMAACSAGGKLLASPLTGTISALSADGTKWEPLTALATPRFFHRLLPVGMDSVVAVGGSNRKVGQVLTPEIISLTAPPPASIPAPKATLRPASGKIPSEPGDTAQWPQWRGPQRDGISVETGWRKDWPAEGPRVLWKKNVGAGMTSCVVVGGRLFTQGNDGKGTDTVFALDTATGEELWRCAFPCKSEPHEMPMVPPGPGATPTVAGAHVFALSREGELLALDTASGQIGWRKNLVRDLGGKRPVYGYSQSPLLVQGRIFLDVGAEKGATGSTGSTVALDAATGEVKWRTGTGEAGYSSARTLERDGRRYIAMFKGEALDVFDPADGRVVWSFATTARDFSNAATPVFIGHRILVSNTSADESAALLDWDTGETPNPRCIWKHKQFALLFNSAIPLDGHLFAYNEKRRGHHEFTCVDAATGETRWVSDAVPTGTFILADGHWLILTREGDLALAPANTVGLKPAARFHALDGKCYATPTLAAGRLYVRNNAGDIAAFDLRPSLPPQTAR